jgi:GDP-D-mannose dehydratase
VELLLGDPTKAKQTLGWTPAIKFEELMREMVFGTLPDVLASTLHVV